MIKVGVVFGGQSGEHEVSCVSAYHVIEHMKGTEIVPIGITKEGIWNIYNGDYEKIASGEWETDKDNLIEDIDFKELRDIDVFFPVLHGPMGEDGTVQGLFEMLGKPYVGCGVLASSVGMDKILSKVAFTEAGINSCKYLKIDKKEFIDDPEAQKQRALQLGLPLFVKPANMGSSVGVRKVADEEELLGALEHAFNYDRRVIVEEFVPGREIECAVLEEDGVVRAATPGEIIPGAEFYDYKAKYDSGGKSVSVIPAQIPKEALEKIEGFAIRAFKAIDGTGLSRVDFFYTKDGDVLINEINTMPGFTPISMYPMMWENSGIDYDDLISRLLAGASRKRIG